MTYLIASVAALWLLVSLLCFFAWTEPKEPVSNKLLIAPLALLFPLTMIAAFIHHRKRTHHVRQDHNDRL